MARIPMFAMAIAIVVISSPASAEMITFGSAQLGAMPKDFVPALTGNGAPGRWEVVEDVSADGARALAQLSQDNTDYRFPLAIYMPTVPSDIEARIRFKPISGSVAASQSGCKAPKTTLSPAPTRWRTMCASIA